MKTDKEKILEMMQSLDEMKQRMDPILKNIERLCDNIERLTKVPAFKDGDFITNDFYTAIFKEYAKDGKLVAYCLEGPDCGFIDDGSLSEHHLINFNYRRADCGRISDFYETMNKNGKHWDAASRKVIEYKWMPKFDETYWTVEFSREDCVASYKYETEDFDGIIFGNGVVFQTRDEAIECAKKMLDAIK